MKKVIIHTDGACLGNPGSGGWPAILELADTPHKKEISGGFRLTTNNRMEIMAALEALSALKEPFEVELYSDSQYLCNAVGKGWLRNWSSRNWNSVKNADLWKRMVELLVVHDVKFTWKRGHANDTRNERCDTLARAFASKGKALPKDVVYEELKNCNAY